MNRACWPVVQLALIGLGVAGCAPSSRPTSAPPNPGSAFQSDTGSDVQQRLGQPDQTARLPNGDTVMTYHWSRVQSVGGYTTAGGQLYTGSPLNIGRKYVPAQTVNLNCVARFTVGADDKVRSVELQGNSCFAEPK